MIYAAVGTIHFYRKDFVPSEPGTTYGETTEKNRVLVDRVREEIISIFGYELSNIQMAKALDAYGADGQAASDTPVYVPKAA
jgi:hypothetical protein